MEEKRIGHRRATNSTALGATGSACHLPWQSPRGGGAGGSQASCRWEGVTQAWQEGPTPEVTGEHKCHCQRNHCKTTLWSPGVHLVECPRCPPQTLTLPMGAEGGQAGSPALLRCWSTQLSKVHSPSREINPFHVGKMTATL